MSVRNILVQIDRDECNTARIALSVNLAEKHGAHLIGLFTYANLSAAYPYAEGYFARDPHAEGHFAREWWRRHEETTRETAAELRAEFEQRAGRAGVSHEWRMEEERGHAHLVTQARYADFVVIGQSARGQVENGRRHNLAEEVVMASGSPTIVVPYTGRFNEAIERVVIAWNGSRESSRAVRDAMPILRSVDEVIVFGVDPDSDHLPGADIASHLARHGVRTEVKHTVAGDIEVGDAILNAVADHAADLLVMGAYGHTRLREFVLGGATRHILRHMTAPTLLTH